MNVAAADNIPAPEPEVQPDRRASFRMMTTLRIGMITCRGEQELCLIRNISEGGLMLRVFREHAVGERVEVEIRSDSTVSGIIAWVRDDSMGVTFDEPIDALELLSTAPRPDGWLPRAPRLEANTRARIRIADGEWLVELRDLSQGGAKIRVYEQLTVGDEATLIVNGLKPLKSVVRWQVGESAGLSFIGTLPLADLVGWMNVRRGIGRRPQA